MLTKNDQDRMRTIIRHALDKNERWLSKHNIWAGQKGEYVVVNYASGERNEFDRLVRGLVLRHSKRQLTDELDHIVSFPFIRFYNQHEENAASINFQNSQMVEKLDGTMVGVFSEGDVPRWHTRKMISTHSADAASVVRGLNGETYRFLDVIGEFVQRVRWNKADRDMTFIFEFIHHACRGRTEYRSDQFGLYLIGARHLKTHREMSEEELQELAARLDVSRPRLWDALEENAAIEKMMREMREETPGFEGFVFRDRDSGERIKIKDPDYVKWCHMLNEISFKRLVPLYLKGESKEILAYLPMASDRIEKIEEKVHGYLDLVVESCLRWRDEAKRDRLNRKRLYAEVSGEFKDKFLIGQIMKHFEESDDEVIFEKVKADLWRLGGAEESHGQLARFMNLVGLHE